MATGTIDWNERQLCDDGACTGVIGREGACGTCGRAAQFWGDERRRGMRADDEVEAEVQAKRKVPRAEGPIAERRLCVDGSCTGLVGADGRCKVCGTVDPGAPEDDEPGDGPGDDPGDDGDGDGDGEGEPDDGDGDEPYDDDDDDGPYDDDDGGDPEDDKSLDDGSVIATAGADERRLCPDGACTGLIGADGRCKVCGAAAES